MGDLDFTVERREAFAAAVDRDVIVVLDTPMTPDPATEGSGASSGPPDPADPKGGSAQRAVRSLDDVTALRPPALRRRYVSSTSVARWAGRSASWWGVPKATR